MNGKDNSWLVRRDIRDRVVRYAGGQPLCNGVFGQRERSYDHCYNYFQSTKLPTHDNEKSCAVLGFYLASWGMYRGSSYLFGETNSSHFVPVIQYIEEHRDTLCRIDVDGYSAEDLERIQDAYKYLSETVLPEGNAAVTLVTKILAGVFGCTPAYDTYFRKGIRTVTRHHSRERFQRLTGGSLELLSKFYEANQADIDALQENSLTWRFSDSIVPTGKKFTKAKILDMYFFDLGRWPQPPGPVDMPRRAS
jgi:hypothetical protein